MKVATSIRRIVDQFDWRKGCETWKSGSYDGNAGSSFIASVVN